jgi:hypothetical protein
MTCPALRTIIALFVKPSFIVVMLPTPSSCADDTALLPLFMPPNGFYWQRRCGSIETATGIA